MGSTRLGNWIALVACVAAAASAEARPIALIQSSTRSDSTLSYHSVGDGVYQATTSQCFPFQTQWPSLQVTYDGYAMTAPVVIGVFWPGPQPANPTVHALCRDFVTDLFNGPYWAATMPQYVGSAHGVYLASIDIPALLTMAPTTTVHQRDIAGELRAQLRAGVLPNPTLGNTIYVVHFPPGVTITDETYNYDICGGSARHSSIGNSCVDYCAYHDSYVNCAVDTAFTFAVIPDFSANGGCTSGCGYGTPFDVYTEVLAHELLETVSNPFAGGWQNSCPQLHEEIADACSQWKFYVPRRTSTPGTPQCPNRWAMSSVFSNSAYNVSTAAGCVVADATTPNCTVGVVPEPPLASQLELAAPRPNPATQSARLQYTLPFASFVRLVVTDVAGRRVAVLHREVEAAGLHEATWDARDQSGHRAPSGIYFARLEAAGHQATRAIVLSR